MSPTKQTSPSLSRREATIGVLSAATVGAIVSVGVAHAQAVQLVAVDVMAVGQGYQISKLIGRSVQNDKAEKIGTVDDFIVTKERSRSETLLQWMDDPETSKRFFAAIDDDELGFRLHEADNAVNKVLCAARRNGAPRDAADLMMIVERYAPLGPLVWAVCGKDENLTPPQVIRDIRKHAFGYADVEFETIRTKDADPITREKVRSVLTSALDDAATYCEAVAPTDFMGWLFVDKNYIPVEATAQQLHDKTAFAMSLRQFRVTPQFIS